MDNNEKKPVSAAPASEGAVQRRAPGVKRNRRVVPKGIVHIKATYNNTIVSFTDPNGNAIAFSSAGGLGFRGPKKATPYVAGLVVKAASEKAIAAQMKEIDVRVRGVGAGREAAVRALPSQGFHILSIKDVTPVPHNGCRPRKTRRI